jgi:hypothetical protein
VDGGKLMERWVVTDLHSVLEEIREPSALEDCAALRAALVFLSTAAELER